MNIRSPADLLTNTILLAATREVFEDLTLLHDTVLVCQAPSSTVILHLSSAFLAVEYSAFCSRPPDGKSPTPARLLMSAE